MPATPRTLFDKIWDAHTVADLGHGMTLLLVDRNLLHDLSGLNALDALEANGRSVTAPETHVAVPDHAISTAPDRMVRAGATGFDRAARLKAAAERHGLTFLDINDPRQGIVHVIGPELGLTQPGLLMTCGDSHTSTHGGLGALAFGIGSSDLVNVLAHGCVIQKRPKTMRVTFSGQRAAGVTPKDVILHLIGEIGAAGGNDHAVEYAGSAVTSLEVEGRLTLCNMSIELGAKVGMIAPDDEVFTYLQDRPMAPQDADLDRAVAHWRTLPSDADAAFDRELEIDTREIAPQITWGTSPEHTVPITGRVPDPATAPDAGTRAAWLAAQTYMGLAPGDPMLGQPVDHVFIGSCTNARISDLRAAAQMVRGRRVAAGVEAWVVPGSMTVRAEAEREGLADVFRAAGFQWRMPGCSSCVAVNGETVAPGARCVSTTNRNFVGRQGPNARTHLASPEMAAAAAINGCIADPRRMSGAGK